MKVAVTGMKNIRDAQAVLFGHPVDRDQDLRQPGSRDHGVHRDHVRSETSHRTESSLAAEPELGAFFIVFGNSNLVSAVLPADVDNRGRGFFESFAKTVHFD